MTTAVAAIIPAYRRPGLLARALASLETQRPRLARVIVVNNSSEPAIADVVSNAGIPARILDFGCNVGTSAGIAAGLHEFLADAELTHAWVLDDDACATPGALDAMLQTAEIAQADAVAPLITDGTGRVGWFPGPLKEPAWSVIRRQPTPEDFVWRCGDKPWDWNWAIWASLLISRRGVETVGYPRLDLWSQFSDIEFTLRLSAAFRCVLAPTAVCQHLPPPGDVSRSKLSAALQNGAFVALRLPHGRRAARHLPGLFFRHLRHYRWHPGAWAHAIAAVGRGAFEGPASAEIAGADNAPVRRLIGSAEVRSAASPPPRAG